jgi:2,4-dienoyl-CoA reductase-like NADH-dependent reductase (Old Yellow Enzyme family)
LRSRLDPDEAATRKITTARWTPTTESTQAFAASCPDASCHGRPLPPFALGNLTLANRIVMAPMTRNHSPDGVPGDDVVAITADGRARRGVDLTEGTVMTIRLVWQSARAVVPWRCGAGGMGEGGHRRARAGGRIMPQLWHVGWRASLAANQTRGAAGRAVGLDRQARR